MISIRKIKLGIGTDKPNKSKSFMIYLFGSVLNILASYGMLMVLLRILPKEEYGQYGLYVSIFSMLLIIFNFGHKEAIFKFSSHLTPDNRNKLLGVFHSFYLWNIVVLIAIQFLLLFNLILYLVAMTFLFGSWLASSAAYFRGIGEYKVDAFSIPVQRVMWLISSLIIYFTLDELSLFEVFLSALIATFICLLIFSIPLFKEFKALSVNNNKKINQLRLLISFFIIEIASVFYLKADVLLLRLYDTELSQIADYFFAIQLFEMMVLIITPIGYFYFNGLSKKKSIGNRLTKSSVVNDSQLFEITKFISPMLGLVVTTHIATFLLAPILFPILIPNYSSSISTVILILFSLYPVAFNILLSSRLIFENNELVFAKICFVALIFNIILNVLLIPWLGVSAALLVKFFTELIITLMLLKAVKLSCTVIKQEK